MPEPLLFNDRNAIRLAMRQRRRQVPPILQQHIAVAISHYVSLAPWFQPCQHLAFYWPTPGEIDTLPLMQCAWQAGKTCYLPICCDKTETLIFAPYRPGDKLIPNRYGIPEPPKPIHPLPALDLIFTPLLAFDKQGNRLGSGKGYYDKTFADGQQCLPPKLIGLAYGFQEIPDCMKQPWDIPLHQVVIFDTNSGRVHENH